MWSDLTFDCSFKVKQGWANLKVLPTPLFFVLEVWDAKLTYRKSWAGSLLIWSYLPLGPLLQGQTWIAKLKMLITRYCIHRIASGGYYGLRMSTPPPQCVEIFSLPL